MVAEDIGKLPDNNASEALARITGVQVNRSSDEAGGVQVRGLPNLTTTYNGREMFTAELRNVALQDFPAGALAGLEVYKTTSADLIEGGIAAIGSGGNYALAAAKARADYEPDADKLARRAMAIAAEVCVFTNDRLTVETV